MMNVNVTFPSVLLPAESPHALIAANCVVRMTGPAVAQKAHALIAFKCVLCAMHTVGIHIVLKQQIVKPHQQQLPQQSSSM